LSHKLVEDVTITAESREAVGQRLEADAVGHAEINKFGGSGEATGDTGDFPRDDVLNLTVFDIGPKLLEVIPVVACAAAHVSVDGSVLVCVLAQMFFRGLKLAVVLLFAGADSCVDGNILTHSGCLWVCSILL
jgi:hypothetical protein